MPDAAAARSPHVFGARLLLPPLAALDAPQVRQIALVAALMAGWLAAPVGCSFHAAPDSLTVARMLLLEPAKLTAGKVCDRDCRCSFVLPLLEAPLPPCP